MLQYSLLSSTSCGLVCACLGVCVDVLFSRLDKTERAVFFILSSSWFQCLTADDQGHGLAAAKTERNQTAFLVLPHHLVQKGNQ